MSTDDLVLNSRMQVCTSIKQAPSRYLYVLGHIFAWHWCNSGKQPLVVYRGNEPYLQLKLRWLMAQSHLHQATAYPGCQTSMSILRNFFWLGHVAGFSLLYRRPWRLRTKILCYHCLRKMCQNHILDSSKCYQNRYLFKAILYEIYKIWTRCYLVWKKKGRIKSKWPKSAENIPLAIGTAAKIRPLPVETWPQTDQWLWEWSKKNGWAMGWWGRGLGHSSNKTSVGVSWGHWQIVWTTLERSRVVWKGHNGMKGDQGEGSRGPG